MKPDHHSLPLRPRLRVDAEPERVAEQLNALTRAQERLQGLLDAVLTISRELELPEVLHQIVSTATDMVGARYGALAVVNERRTGLSEFITVGLTGQERADLAAVGQPQGRGLLGQLIHHTEPLRAAQVRSGAEQFQRLLLPRLPNLHTFTAAAIYRPATAPAHLGGDWYDAVLLPDSACAAVIGDVVGYNLESAAAMAQTRHMLRALLYDRRTPPSAVLCQLDRTLQAITDNPLTTACLARIEPGAASWTLRWSTAGHLPPLLITPDGQAACLHAEPGLPLGVDTDQPRPDHNHPLPADSTVIFFTDGLVEHPHRSIDTGLRASPRRPPPTPTCPSKICARSLRTTIPATATTTWPFSPCAHRPGSQRLKQAVAHRPEDR